MLVKVQQFLWQLWTDVRPNLIWWLLFGGGLVVIYTKLMNWMNEPVTIHDLIFISFILSAFFIIGTWGYKRYKRIETPQGRRIVNISLVWLPVILGLAFCIWAYIVGNKISQMSNDVDLLQKRMVRYVLPRKLTAEQKAVIAEYISKFDPQPIVMKVISRDEEASSYRADLQQALEKGGWPVATVINDDTLQAGLHIHITEPNPPPGQPDPFDRLKPKKKPTEILREAFTQAGVFVSGMGSGGGQNITNTTITISIGNRRRDKWAIPPSNFLQQRRAELPDDPDIAN